MQPVTPQGAIEQELEKETKNDCPGPFYRRRARQLNIIVRTFGSLEKARRAAIFPVWADSDRGTRLFYRGSVSQPRYMCPPDSRYKKLTTFPGAISFASTALFLQR